MKSLKFWNLAKTNMEIELITQRCWMGKHGKLASTISHSTMSIRWRSLTQYTVTQRTHLRAGAERSIEVTKSIQFNKIQRTENGWDVDFELISEQECSSFSETIKKLNLDKYNHQWEINLKPNESLSNPPINIYRLVHSIRTRM